MDKKLNAAIRVYFDKMFEFFSKEPQEYILSEKERLEIILGKIAEQFGEELIDIINLNIGGPYKKVFIEDLGYVLKKG